MYYCYYAQARDQTTVIYIDFKKHSMLFIGLQSYNITGRVLQWLNFINFIIVIVGSDVVAHNKQKLVCHCLMFSKWRHTR